MLKEYKNKMQKEETTKEEKKEEKIKVEVFFFPPQDGYPEFSCQASSLEEALQKYQQFKNKNNQ